MQAILACWPRLGVFCFADPDAKYFPLTAGQRGTMLWDSTLAAFIAGRAWLGRSGARSCSYKRVKVADLKRIARADIGYVPSGVMIAAALAEGLQVKPIAEKYGGPWVYVRLLSREIAGRTTP
jgi:hypothetical protein